MNTGYASGTCSNKCRVVTAPFFFPPMNNNKSGLKPIHDKDGKVIGHLWNVKPETMDEFLDRVEAFGIDASNGKVLHESLSKKWYVRLWKKIKFKLGF
jgi:hypothetical protein